MGVFRDPWRESAGSTSRVGLSGIVARFGEAGEATAAIAAARATLAQPGCCGRHVDAIVIGAADAHVWQRDPERLGADILDGLGFEDIPVIGTTLGGHANMATTLRVARNLIAAEGASNVLVIETWQAADGSARLGAVSLLVTEWEPDFELLSMAQAVQTTCGEPAVQPRLAGYRDVMEQVLARSSMALPQVDAVFLADSCEGAATAIVGALGLPLQRLARRQGEAATGGARLLQDLQLHARALARGARLLLLCRGGVHHFAIACRKSS